MARTCRDTWVKTVSVLKKSSDEGFVDRRLIITADRIFFSAVSLIES